MIVHTLQQRLPVRWPVLGTGLLAAGYVLLGWHQFPVKLLGAGLFAAGVLLLAAGFAAERGGVPSLPGWVMRAIALAGAVLAAAGVLRLVLALDNPLRFPATQDVVWRDWLILEYPDLSIALGAMAVAAIVATRRYGPNALGTGLYSGAAAAFVAVGNLVFLAVAGSWIHPFPDSLDYLSPNACRVPGYFLFIKPFMQAGPQWLVLVQLNLLLLAKVALSAAIYRLTGSATAGILALLLGAWLGGMFTYSFTVLTEAPFAALFGLAAAAGVLYVWSPIPRYAAALGGLLGAAMVLKAVAPVLVVAVAPLLLLRTPHRLRNGALMIGVPLACFVVLCGYGRVANGAWSPSNFGGFSLASHVAWGIQSDGSSSDPELSRLVEEKVRPYVANWPPMSDLRGYVRSSTNDLNPMFWYAMLPAVAKYVHPESRPVDVGDLESRPVCTPQLNAALTTLAREAIVRQPVKFAAHVAAHFGALWSLSILPVRWRELAANARLSDMSLAWTYAAMPVPWQATAAQLDGIAGQNKRYENFGLLVDAFVPKPSRFLQVLSLCFGALSLALMGFAAVLPRLPKEWAALVLLALLLNAFYLGQALFQPVLPRYAGTAEIPLAGFIALCVVAAVRSAARRWRAVCAPIA